MKSHKIILIFIFSAISLYAGLTDIKDSKTITKKINVSKNPFYHQKSGVVGESTINTLRDTRNWGSAGGYLCGGYYIDDKLKKNVSVELSDINFASGEYVCNYKDDSGIFSSQHIGKIETIETINAQIHKSGKINHPDYADIPLVEVDKKVSVIAKSAQMGLWHGDYLLDGSINPYAGVENENRVTYLRILTGMATLNDDYVTGVAADGKIIYSKEAIEGTTILVDETHIGNQMMDSISDFYNKYFNKDAAATALEVTGSHSESFLDYFDKYTFGYYYLLDKFAFSQAFERGSAVMLFMVVAFLTLTVGATALLKKSEKRNFEFTYSQQLAVFAGTFLLAFLPIGATSSVDSQGRSQIVSQTSFAKEAISFMSDFGAKLADYVSDNGSITYIYYLGNKVGSHGYETLVSVKSDFALDASIESMNYAFYTSHCSEETGAYPQFLSGETQEDDHKKWKQDVNPKWKDVGAKRLFENDKFADVSISPALCENLKRNSIISRTSAIKDYEKLRNSISSYSSGDATQFDYLAQSMLYAIKNYGFLASAGMPILHLFSKYNSAFMTDGDLDENRETLAKYNENLANANIIMEKPSVDFGNQVENLLGSAISTLSISSSVYFMMPMFSNVFDFSKAVATKSVEATTSIIGIFTMFTPKGVLNMGRKAVLKSAKKLKRKSSLRKNLRTENSSIVGGFMDTAKATAIFFVALSLAKALYIFLINVILISVITLFIIAKILFWIIDIVKYRYITTFVVFWAVTVNQNSSKIGEYLLRGLVLLVARPVLIVMSVLLFIFTYELMNAVYFNILDFFNYILNTAFYLGDNNFVGRLLIDTVYELSNLFIHLFGIYLAYIIILDGDNWFLKQLGYSDAGDNGQAIKPLSDKIDKTVGKV